MEDEIDLGKYAGIVIGRWKLIIGLVIVVGLIAFLISSVIEPLYEATALVTVTRARYQLEFDPRIEAINTSQVPPYRAYPELALSDDLLVKVIETVNGDTASGEQTLADISVDLGAEAGADPSLIRLHVTSKDPAEAQLMVNTWASLYVDYTNELFQQQSSDVTFFEAQVADARDTLEASEQTLIEFQGRNPLLKVSTQLTATQETLKAYLGVSRSVSLLIQDAQGLRQQLMQQDSNALLGIIDELTALYLQVNTLSANTPIPIDLHLGENNSLQSRTVGEQIVALDALMAALQGKSQTAQQQAGALEAQLLELQQAQQTAQVELDRLVRERDVANETYLTLTRKLAEARVASAGTTAEVRLASQAALPTEPVSPRKGLNTMLGGVLGLLIGVTLALALGARQSTRQASPAPAR